jgi:hypothetical protein
MLLYKIEAQELNGRCHIWPFGEEKDSAEKTMRNLAGESVPRTVWAELKVCGDASGPDAAWDVEYGFEREVDRTGETRRFTGRMIWF